MPLRPKWLRLVWIAVSVLFSGCGEQVSRPANVPEESVYSPGVKGGYWQWCRMDKGAHDVLCAIYRDDGVILYEEVFLPYDAEMPVREDELVIVPYGRHDTIVLASGRLLFPKSDYDKARNHWDWTYEDGGWVKGRHPRVVRPPEQ